MAYEDLRHFIRFLEEKGELKRVPLEVDWRYEVAGWVRRTMDLRPKGPALFFENIKGYSKDYRILSAAVGTYPRFAMALGLDPHAPPREIINVFKERIEKPIQPAMVSTGPVKENIHTGGDINLFKFPVPWWTPRDGGRYMGTWHGVVTKDPDTGQRNVGMYRVMVHDEKHTGLGFLPFTQMGYHYAERERRDQALEVALVIGADETVPMVAGTGFPPSVDEFTMAGALRQEPVELVKCETVDLEVPANAEIVVEGLLLPHERKGEGPFSEHTGYHGGGVRMRPILKVTAVCHRNQPIFRGCLLGKPTTEDHILYDIGVSSAALRMFETHGPAGVVAVHCPPEGDSISSAVIAMRPHYIGHSRNVGRTMLSSAAGKYTKYVIVVDDDIDPFDLGQVWWALITRTQGSRDIEVMRYGTTSRSDPSVPRDHGEYTDKVLIDATKKLDYPYNAVWQGHWAPTGMPPKEVLQLVELKWQSLFQGNRENEARIAELQADVRGRVAEKWEKWRRKAYTLSEEDKKREIALSYPILAEDE